MSNEYNSDAYKKEISTHIKTIFEEEGKTVIALEENIFYPRGGGQKGDRGLLEVENGQKIQITDTIKDQYSNDVALLVVEIDPDKSLVGKLVDANIDWEYRYRQMRLHSALHLHHCMIEKVMEKQVAYPITADIQDGFGFNRYDDNSITEEVVNQANLEFLNAIKDNAEIVTYPDPENAGYRWWECLGYKIPCGGTHVKSTSEIGDVHIKFSGKKGKSTITITLT